MREPGEDPLNPKVLLLAFTGTAASLIGKNLIIICNFATNDCLFTGGTTIHSGLDFKFGSEYSDLTGEAIDKFRRSLRGLVGVIIDEMSMVPADILYNVHKRLQQIMLSEDLFGGCFVLLVGDLCQLPPVQGKTIYEIPRTGQNRSLYNSTANLWQSCDVVQLTTNFRQGKESSWTQTLNRIRLGQDFITDEDVKLLESRRMRNFPDINFDDASHIFYKNVQVNNYNMRRLSSLKTPLVTIEASIFHAKQHKPYIDPELGTIDGTSFLKRLELKVGARVMLTFNVSVIDSLTNGAIGTLIDVVYQENSNEVKCLIVAFDHENVGERQREQYAHIASKYSKQNGTPIFRQQLEYQPKKKSKSKTFKVVKNKVLQFPLRLSWAFTCHKIQGHQFKKGQNLVCHGGSLRRNMAYVMLSRCSDVNNVFIDDAFDVKSIKALKGSLNQNTELEERSLTNIAPVPYDIAFLNVHSLPKHWEDIQSDQRVANAKHIALVEVWLKNGEQSNYKHPERGLYYSLYGHGKGVCIYSSTLDKNSMQLGHEHFQCVSVAIRKDLQLIVVYMSSKITKSEQEEFAQYFSRIQDFDKQRIVVGDFNFGSTDDGLIPKLFKAFGFSQLVKRATHNAGRTIDHLYVTDKTLIQDLDFHAPYYTDHSGIFIQLTKNKDS